MRFPRTAVLARFRPIGAPAVTLVEAPTGFGKSWLLRRSSPAGAIRLRAQLGPLAEHPLGTSAVIIDDAHLLGDDDVTLLASRIEDADPDASLVIAGRMLPEQLHAAAQLLDGQLLDASSLAVTADELLEVAPQLGRQCADQVVHAACGSVKHVAMALQQWSRQLDADPATIVAQLVRNAHAAALQHLDDADRLLVGLLARAPGIDRSLLATLGGDGFVGRALAAGIPLQRQLSGELDVLDAGYFRAHDIEPATATRLAAALIRRDRPLEAAGLLLDAGVPDRAARTLRDLPESAVRSVDPRAMLSLLARLGSVVDGDPGLLLLRANAVAPLGQREQASRDIERAAALVHDAEPPIRRRVQAAVARTIFLAGDREAAMTRARAALRDIGPGEEHTYARAHAVLALATAAGETRADLQLAAESFRVAASVWETCGEHALARACRCDLAMAALIPLGRFDEALAVLSQTLAVPGLTDAERTWLLTCEGFALLEANRLDSATERFDRVADLGYVQDNSSTVAMSAWGRALVAARRGDLPTLLRLIAIAENTALGDTDDAVGVNFLCDVVTVLGALGELDRAEQYLVSAESRSPVFGNDVRRARFVLAARRGVVGALDDQLAVTRPAEWWRVLLVAAVATARRGDLAAARKLRDSAQRELLALGFADFAAIGERLAADELAALLAVGTADHDVVAAAPAPVTGDPPPMRRVRVIGAAVAVEDSGRTVEVPAGNPQRLVGVVAANGGLASFDQLADALWPGDDAEASRARLRNVLLRLRQRVGDVLVRSGSGVRLAPGVGCDLFEFEQLATDALAAARSDPDVAGQLAARALELADGAVLTDFEYEEWAVAARRSVEQRLIGLLDLLSVQAEDAGDLPRAQALAERALRLDRYTDSRYVRLAELMTMQGRTATALAVLEDAAEVSRELGATVAPAAKRRRDDLLRRAVN